MDTLSENVLKDLEVVPTLINLVLVLILGQILSWHYQRFSQVLSNKRKFARLFIILGATTMMVISVVKSSLALSLGLVGALSIIRFRTPIKEPEDLAYLFLALAAGIGLGADQRVATCIMFLGILLALTVFHWFRSEKGDTPRVYAHVNAKLPERGNQVITTREALRQLMERVRSLSPAADVRRVDAQEGRLNLTLILDLKNSSEIGSLISSIQELYPDATVTVVEGAGLAE